MTPCRTSNKSPQLTPLLSGKGTISDPNFSDLKEKIELAEDQARERSERRDYENEVLENKSEVE